MLNGKMRIGLILDYLSSEYSENLLNGIASYCKENNVELLVYTIGEIKSTSEGSYNYQNLAITALIKKENIDGIIIDSGTQLHGMSKKEFLSYLRSYKSVPMVNVSMVLPKIPSITADSNQAFDSMLQYIIDVQHCKKIALMGVNSNSQEVKNRTQIFKNVLKRNNLYDTHTLILKSNFEYSSAYHQLDAYLKKHKTFDYDAIVSLNDDTAYACIDFVQKRLHKDVPQDILVTGFDDLQRASFSNPTLTSVNQQVDYQGYIAAQTLCKILREEDVPMTQEIKAKTILRQSSRRNASELYNEDYMQDDLSEDVNDKFSVSEWYNRRSQLLQAAQFYAQMNHQTELTNVGSLLTESLKNYGFQSTAIIVYEKPVEMHQAFEYFNLPHKAIVLGGFDYKTGFDGSKIKTPVLFDPNDWMLPPGLINISTEGSILIALYHNEIQYGYIILDRSSYDAGVYDVVAKAIANQIESSFSYTNFLREKTVITDKYTKLDLIANTDELTGLRNRRGFIQIGQATMNYSEATGTTGLVIFCDMDGLKKINDTYGHEAGDEAIKAQGQILRQNFRGNDVLSRLGGDEFAVISPGMTEEKFLELKANIDKDCAEWTKNNQSPFGLSISMGYCLYPDEKNGYQLNKILSDADSSLYKEKRRKKANK
ncbi:MAG: GGDEF domain-containing protein [Treponema sp.]|nr:GGDEF domain-containing protein [Treponema sp.]